MGVGFTKLKQRITNVKQLRYVLSGATAAVVEYLSFAGLFYVAFGGSRIVLSQAISYCIGLVLAFTLHYLWTFRSQNTPNLLKQQFILYTLTALINILFTAVIIAILVRLDVAPWLAKFVVMAAVVLWNYAILNRVIFDPKHASKFTLKNIRNILKQHVASLILMTVMIVVGSIHIAVVRPGVGHDEEPHLAKAEATSRLDFLPHQREGHDYFVSRGSEDLYMYVIHNIEVFYQKNKGDAQKILDNIETLGRKSYRDSTVGLVPLTGAGGYNSVNYIPNALGLVAARKLNLTIKQTYYAAKISALLLCTAVVAAAFTLLRNYRSRFLIAAIALFPPVLFSFSGITTDGLLNASSLLFAAILLRSFFDKTAPSWAMRSVAYALAIILPITKLPYLLLSLLIFFTPLTRFRRLTVVKNLALLVALLAAVFGWTYLVRDATNYTSQHAYCCTKGTEANAKGQVSYIIHHPDQFAASLAQFTFDANIIDGSRISMPQEAKRHMLNGDFLVIYIILMIIMSFYVADDFKKHRLRKPLKLWLIASLLTVLGIIGALYVASNSVGQFVIWGVQTRYFYPTLIFVLCYIAASTPFIFRGNNQRFVRVAFLITLLINALVVTQLYILPKTFTLEERIQKNSTDQV